MSLQYFELGLPIVRWTTAYVFLFAAWRNTENAAAWAWTKNETALLFAGVPEPQRSRIAAAAAVAGMVMMYGGGISVLGLEPRIGGPAIAVFSAIGMRIHAIRRDEAKAAGEAGNDMGWSAYGAHVAAGLKNIALIGVGALCALTGGGRFATDFVGKWLL